MERVEMTDLDLTKLVETVFKITLQIKIIENCFTVFSSQIYVFFSSTNVENSNPKLAQLLHKIQDTIVMGDEVSLGGID